MVSLGDKAEGFADMVMFRSLFSLMRVHQWVKNVFVLLPLFFGGRMLDSWCLWQGLLAFAAFSLMASAVYCFNDLSDIESDRRHPDKRSRPLASGKVRPVHAVVLMIVLVCASLSISFFALGSAAVGVMSVLIIYLMLNIAYSCKLKRIAIIDVFIVALGFVLRLLTGGYACDIRLSSWIVVMTFLLALFLAIAKRRNDVAIYNKDKGLTQNSAVNYDLPFLNRALGLTGAITVVCYIMYSVTPEVEDRFGNEYIYVTSIFVMAGILRYLQLVIDGSGRANPMTVILHDRFIQICILLWFATFVLILYCPFFL